MKINFKVIIGLVLIALVAYFAVTSVLPTTASGQSIAVESSSGSVTIENGSDESVAVVMTARGAFRVTVSGDEPTELVSARTGSGRSAAQTIETELPPGPAVLTITRGSDVRFELTSEATIQATAVPRNEDDARNLLLLAGVVILGLLFYVSNATQHRWLKLLRGGKTASGAVEPASA